MSQDQEPSLTQPRRRDRAVNDEAWMRAFLHRAPYGCLATVHDGQPFINMNIFVYDEPRHSIYFHTAHAGRTRTNVEADGRVCFSVSTMGRFLPSPVAAEFSVEYAGVTLFGKAAVVSDVDEARTAMQMLLDKYFPHLRPGPDYRPITDGELARTTVYRLTIEQMGGKQKVVAADFPGAFNYPPPGRGQP